MFDLAQNVGEGPQTIRSIAERQLVPEQYLEQIIGTLRREGDVRSLRGAQGGSMLAKAPAEVTIGELIRLLEGPVMMADCMADAEGCIRSQQCPSRLVWERLTQQINSVVDAITLQDMLEDHEKLMAEAATGEESTKDGQGIPG